MMSVAWVSVPVSIGVLSPVQERISGIRTIRIGDYITGSMIRENTTVLEVHVDRDASVRIDRGAVTGTRKTGLVQCGGGGPRGGGTGRIVCEQSAEDVCIVLIATRPAIPAAASVAVELIDGTEVPATGRTVDLC